MLGMTPIVVAGGAGRTGGGGGGILAVQSGLTQLSSADGTTKTQSITAVVLNKSFLVFSFRSEDSGQDPNDTIVTGKILNTTTLEFKSNGLISNKTYVEWFVIEFAPTAPVNVQHSGDVTVTGTTQNISISSVDLAHSFPIVTTNTAQNTLNETSLVSAELTSSTNLQIQLLANNSNVITWQVIEHTGWDVTKYTDSMLAGDTVEDTPITAVTLSETMLIASVRAASSGNLIGNGIPSIYFSSSSNIKANRQAADKALDFVYYVIDTNGTVAVQNLPTEQIPSGAFNQTTTITAVNLTKAAMYMLCPGVSIGNNSSDADVACNNIYIDGKFMSNTTIETRRGSNPARNNDHSFQIWEFA